MAGGRRQGEEVVKGDGGGTMDSADVEGDADYSGDKD